MSADCFHCGEPIPPKFEASLSISGETQYFCCYGCQAVAEMIVTGGLENFYKHRTDLAPKPSDIEEAERNELLMYDDPAVQSGFVTTISDDHSVQINEALLSVGGITCAACIWLLEKELGRQIGVKGLSINHSSHKARLSWDPAQIKLSDILLKFRQLGYQAHPFQQDSARLNQEKERKHTTFRIAVAGIAAMQNMMFSVPLYLGYYSGIDEGFISLFRWVSLVMCTPVILYSATPFFKAAYRDLKNRHLTMDVPVSLALLVAFIASAYVTIFESTNIELDIYFDSVS